MLKIVGLPDIHHPEEDIKSMNALDSFLPDFKPHQLVYMGDALDFGYISRHEKENMRRKEGKRILSDYAGMNEIIARHKKVAGNPKVIYMIGNHEDWMNDHIDKHPELEGLMEVENNLKGVDEFVPLNKTYKPTRNSKIHFLHGVYTNQYHAKKTVDNYKRNVLYCHTHTIQSHTSSSPIDRKDFHSAMSCACLCDMNPQYMESRPSAWVNGFPIVYLHDSGLFNSYQVVINKGQFIWNGKVYK